MRVCLIQLASLAALGLAAGCANTAERGKLETLAGAGFFGAGTSSGGVTAHGGASLSGEFVRHQGQLRVSRIFDGENSSLLAMATAGPWFEGAATKDGFIFVGNIGAGLASRRTHGETMMNGVMVLGYGIGARVDADLTGYLLVNLEAFGPKEWSDGFTTGLVLGLRWGIATL